MGQNRWPTEIKNDPAPPGYRITHVHRDNPDQTRGGGLVVLHRDEINVLPRKHNITHSSFEFQLVNIGFQSRDIVLQNIFRPPSSSKLIFIEEFGSLLATLGTDLDRLMISGDFNLSGTSPNEIDDGLADLLNSTGFKLKQHISSPTRYDSKFRTTQDPPYLTLLSFPSTSKFVSTTSVVMFPSGASFEGSGGVAFLRTFQNLPENISISWNKNIDLDLFKLNILSSSLFSTPNPTVDGFADQMETEITSLLDTAPLKLAMDLVPEKQKTDFHLMWMKPRSEDGGLSVVGRLPMLNPTASLTALRVHPQTSW